MLTTSSALSATPPKLFLTDNTDCISTIVNTSSVFKVETKNGREFAVDRDKLGRAVLIKNNGRSYRPLYDENLPQKIIAMKSLADGKMITVPTGPQGALPAKTQQETFRAAANWSLCKNASSFKASVNRGTTSPTKPHLIDEGWDYGEDWAANDFYDEYTRESYWIDVDRPFFDQAVETAAQRTAQSQCVDQVTACLDACDDAADKRTYSCAAGVLAYSEIPIGAALFGIACAMASNYHKNECKQKCPSLSSCF